MVLKNQYIIGSTPGVAQCAEWCSRGDQDDFVYFMSEPNDDRLYDWVRGKLLTYEAPDNPQADWLQMRRRLRRRRWLRQSALAGGSVMVVLGLIWWLTNDDVFVDQLSRGKAKQTEVMNPKPTQKQAQYLKPMANLSVVNDLTEPKLPTEPEKPITRKQKYVALVPLVSSESVPVLIQQLPVIDRIHLTNTPLALTSHALTVPVFGPDEWAIRQQLQTGEFGQDSTAYQVLDRNKSRWADAVAVCDITSSMYPYSSQLIAWFKKQQVGPRQARSTMLGVVFFTDCDSAGVETRPDGPLGQFFVSKELTISSILPVIVKASRHTRNNRFPAENDLDALLFAQRQFPNAKNLILLADNGSPVKGMDKLGLLTKPVRVILAGTTSDSTQAFQADYEAIARQSGGSLHTIEDDFEPGHYEKDPWIRVGKNYYRYIPKKKTYRVSRFEHRPARLVGPLWW